MAYLDVVVPPTIVDSESSGETDVKEDQSVTLSCKAKGFPVPTVSWRREHGKPINFRDTNTAEGI